MGSTHSHNDEGQTGHIKQIPVRRQEEEAIGPHGGALTFSLPSESSPSSVAKLSMKPSGQAEPKVTSLFPNLRHNVLRGASHI